MIKYVMSEHGGQYKYKLNDKMAVNICKINSNKCPWLELSISLHQSMARSYNFTAPYLRLGEKSEQLPRKS